MEPTAFMASTCDLGYNDASIGGYKLSGSGLMLAGSECVGYSGAGTFTQSGGTNSYENLYLGYNLGSSGTYNLSGGSLLSAGFGTEYVGYSGSGTFTQSGGTNNCGNGGLSSATTAAAAPTTSAAMAYCWPPTKRSPLPARGLRNRAEPTPSPTCSQSASLAAAHTTSAAASCWESSEWVGYSAIGIFTQSGGTNSMSQYLSLGGQKHVYLQPQRRPVVRAL